MIWRRLVAAGAILILAGIGIVTAWGGSHPFGLERFLQLRLLGWACFRMGMSGLIDRFPSWNRSSLRQADLTQQILEAWVGAYQVPVPGHAEME